MARPYFTGDYGSPLMSNQAAAMLVADQGAKTGQMYAQMGKDIGGVIKEYGLNKAKKEKATREVEGSLRMDPTLVGRLTGTGDEAWDKKQNTAIEKLTSGNLNLAGIEGLAGDIARLEKQDLKETEGKRQALIDALKVSQLYSEKQARDYKEENQGLVRAEATRKENMYKTGDSMIHNILAEAHNNPDFDPAQLSIKNQKIFLNWEMWQNRQYPLDEFIGDPGDEVDLKILRQQFKNAQQDYEEGKLTKKIKKVDLRSKKDAHAPGEYADLDSVNAELKRQFDKGFIASAQVKPDGTWTISKSVPIAEAKNDLIPIPGHPDVYRFQDSSELFYMPPGETPRKIGVGEGTEARLKQVYLSYFNNATTRWYAEAMRSGKLEDGEYVWDDSEGNEQIVPYDSDMEARVLRVRELEKELEEKIFDIRPATPQPAWYNNPFLQ